MARSRKAEYLEAAASRFDMMDADHDGNLTKAERDAFRERCAPAWAPVAAEWAVAVVGAAAPVGRAVPKVPAVRASKARTTVQNTGP